MKNPKLIIANWKMNGRLNMVQELICKINDNFETTKNSNIIIICPPYSLISETQKYSKANIFIGAQDCSAQKDGAFTGEISAAMLADLGCQYVIIGHSERRKYHNENSEIIKSKISLAHQAGLKVILCIGENAEIRHQRNYLNFIHQQLESDLTTESNQDNTIIAYEPVWSIGTGNAASPEEIEEIHNYLSERFEKKFKIVYGGSVNGDNAHKILAINSVAGVLVGAASLKFEQFEQIINIKTV